MHNHDELSAYLKAIAGTSVELKNLSPEYQKLLQRLFDIYLGPLPGSFVHNGIEFTPKRFAAAIGLDDMSDHIELTSFSHHPFYERVPLEVPDNWDHETLWNVPLEDFMGIIDNALRKGYTVAWDGDLKRGEFNHNRGIAICPEPKDFEEAVRLEKRFPDRTVTQEVRQRDFETFETIDDHLMHLTGLFQDQDGNLFYKTKNSWESSRNEEMQGYLYMSRAYVAMRVISIMVHKDAIPADIREKLQL